MLDNFSMGFLGLLGLVSLGLYTQCNEPNRDPEIFNFTTDQIIHLDQGIDSIFDRHGLMGMAACLFIDTQAIYSRYRGLINQERQITLNERSLFRIASISKTVTAIAAMQLVDLELLELHRDVSHYLGWDLRHPKFPDDSITLFHLLNHRSGIGDGSGYNHFIRAMQKQSVRIRDLFLKGGRYFSDNMFADHRPGTYFSYTNCTWGIIASLIEIVSGERFDQYCKNHIFHPLTMDANFNVSRIKEPDRLAVLYRYQDSVWAPQADYYPDELPESVVPVSYRFGQNGLLFGPQGSLRCSTPDLTKLVNIFVNRGEYNGRRVLSPESTRAMITPHWNYNGSNGDTWDHFFTSYGLGVHCLSGDKNKDVIFPEIKMIGHPGIAYGLLSDMYIDPVSRLGVIFITNGSKNKYDYGRNSSFYQVEEDLFRMIYPKVKTYLARFDSNAMTN